MNRRTSAVWFFALLAVGLAWSGGQLAQERKKQVIGQTARVRIEEVALEFVARVDTGAASTSLHAEAVQIENGMVAFIAVNQDGARVPLRLPLAKTARVRHSGGTRERVYVEMTIDHEGRSKQVCINLNDRSSLTYPLLLGRNWLEDEYVVDVSRPHPTSDDSRMTRMPSIRQSSVQ
jgi:hypothetical protein